MLHEPSAEGVKRGLDQERRDDLSIKMMNTWILRMRSPTSSPQARLPNTPLPSRQSEVDQDDHQDKQTADSINSLPCRPSLLQANGCLLKILTLS
jgi:hypothetical protein